MPKLLRLASLALAGLALAGCAVDPSARDKRHDSASQAVTVCPGGALLRGVDVSSYQGSINWGSVAASGISFGYAKATEGTGYQDPTFAGNWSGMAGAGLKRGAYHFFHAEEDGTQQADFYLNTVGAIGAGDLPPMLDWEQTNPNNGGVSCATAEANAQAFINEISARTGKATVIYTSPGIWNGYGCSGFGGQPLWVADYFTSTGNGCFTSDTSTECPDTPGGWSSWVMWQYGDCGSVGGISGNVDVDVFNGDSSALDAFANGGTCSSPIAVGHPVGGGGAITSACTPGGAPGLLPAPSGCGGLASGEGLGPGQSVTSCDGRFTLVMQSDGNLVLYTHGIALWSTQTAGKGGYLFAMQSDGNLVLYSDGSCPLWSSATANNGGARLALQDDGNVVVYSASGTPLWSSGTGPIPAAPTSCGTIPSGYGLGPGDSISACGGCFTLVMQSDGNLVLYQNGGSAIWSSGTANQGGYEAAMQPDGNLVVYSKSGCPIWQSNTSGQNGAGLSVQDDGNLVIYGSGGAAWNSASVACSGGCTCNSTTTSTSSTSTSTTSAASTSTSGTSSTTGSSTSSTTGTTTTGTSTTGATSSTTSGTTTGATSTSTSASSTTTTTSSGTSSTSGGATSSSGSTGLGSASGSVAGSTGGKFGSASASGGCGTASGDASLSLLCALGLALALRTASRSRR